MSLCCRSKTACTLRRSITFEGEREVDSKRQNRKSCEKFERFFKEVRKLGKFYVRTSSACTHKVSPVAGNESNFVRLYLLAFAPLQVKSFKKTTSPLGPLRWAWILQYLENVSLHFISLLLTTWIFSNSDILKIGLPTHTLPLLIMKKRIKYEKYALPKPANFHFLAPPRQFF